jgi:hypothetical protein
MENIIEALYNLHLQTNLQPFGFDDLQKTKQEIQLYTFLYENLSEKDKKIFLNYMDLLNTRNKEQLLAAYSCGFKTAIKLILQSTKE